MNKTIIKIDVTDGLEMFLREEAEIADEDDVAALVIDRGKSTGQAGLMALAARAAGFTPQHILESDKMTLIMGARAQVNRLIQKYREEIELANGKTYEARTYIGKPGNKAKDNEEDESEPRPQYVVASSDRGVELAKRYIFGSVLGNLWSRLVQIAASEKEDINAIIDGFIAEVEEMREKLT